ncbi:MAG: histidinol dehydrogenase [Spirochaetaceae bacterium]|nr:histidinol dehydrogenase [Spirochaetaceae bacterium]
MGGYSLKRIGPDEVPGPQARLFDPEVDAVAARAIRDVRDSGEAGLRKWAEELGELSPGDRLLYDRDDLEAAYRRTDADVRQLLSRARGRIAAFAAAQRSCLSDLDTAVPGGRAGHKFVPVARAGCYVPGGRYPLPSSALMTVCPAKAAGVGEVWCAGPHPTDTSLAAAWLAGADGFLRCGGAHAIAALAFGAGVPRCDVVVGPGGKYVASAKRQLFGIIGTEAPAGPSELLIVADSEAHPGIIAGDLLAQAEHDTAAVPMLICASEALARKVEEEIAVQLAALPAPNDKTASIALQNGWILVAADEPTICACVDSCAPEHLELLVADPKGLARGIRSAGAIFIGRNSAEVFGDYGAGPNHTLPTGGAARFAAGLSVLNFLRARTWLEISDPGPLAEDSAKFARLERLEGHARAAEVRLSWPGR